MNSFFATVSEIYDDKKFIIKFTRKFDIENAIAYPIDTFDEPNIGDPVIIYELESIFGYSFMYKKMRLKDHTRLKLLESMIDVYDDRIELHAGYDGEESKSKVIIKNDGTILVDTDESVTIETKSCVVNAENEVKIKTKTCEVKASQSAKVESAKVEITGGSLETTKGGTCAPSGMGGFCGIPICPLTGAPHNGNKIVGT